MQLFDFSLVVLSNFSFGYQELFFGFVFLIILVLLLPKKKNKRHIYNIENSKKILEKINTFIYPGQKLNYLRKIDPFVFEELLLTSFERIGYKIKRNKKYTGDGGADGIVFDQKKQKYLIQAKRYSNYINAAHIKEFEILVKKKKCKGFFIHTGKTGGKTYKNINKELITIISGDRLLNLIQDYGGQN